ncbi:uncharacterized protein [Nicotiana tomentosiformis]|uniref:uncharacterized protein n=1 Tax=Nicotiana tomentosiformis TaxID=4098 RepID=UPI00388C8280
MSTIKTLVALAVKRQCPLFQLDVNNAFLHGDLDEKVFMKLSPGYSVPHSSGSDQLRKFVLYPLELSAKLKAHEDDPPYPNLMSTGGRLVVWKSKKQPVVSMSSAKAEYRAMSKVVAELAWLSRLLSDLGLPSSSPVPLFSDSRIAIHIAKNPLTDIFTKALSGVAHHGFLSKLENAHVPNFMHSAYVTCREVVVVVSE